MSFLIDNNKDLPLEIQNGFEEMKESEELSKEYIQSIFIELSAIIVKTITFSDSHANYIEIIKFNNKIIKCESLDKTINLFEELLTDLLNFKTNENKYSKEINQVINYIKKHYNEKISVDQIANIISYSPNYLCTIFKKETDTSLTEYINQIRIENAKQLLNKYQPS